MKHDDIAAHLVVEAARLRYGYDFSGYAEASLKRRLEAFTRLAGLDCVADIVPLLMRDQQAIHGLVSAISVPVTEMFRDPYIHLYLRNEVFPILASYPKINIWVAGCASGEEAFSIAIALEEMDLLKRSRIYATDIDPSVIKKAEDGVFAVEDADQIGKNYRESGGTRSVSDYLTVRYDFAKVSDQIREKLLFTNHNLVSDGVFGEFSLILCRNVLIYFKNSMKERALKLMWNSLARSGFVCLGPKDVPPVSIETEYLSKIDPSVPVYKKIEHAVAS